MKIVFMGTPDFAVGVLDALVKAGHDIVLAVSQEDKPKGRGKSLAFPAVKEYALEHGIEVYQPHRIRDDEHVEYLRKIDADVCVVAAFGQILPKSILEMYKYGCINVHASLLPKYRGAAPIQWSVINGDEKSGVTIMQMNEGLDTGDILYVKELVLDAKETGESLFDRLAVLGAEAITEALDKLEKGELVPIKQDDEQSTYAKMLNKQMGHLDYNKSAVCLERLIRGLNSWPGAYSYLDGKTLKIWNADVVESVSDSEEGTIIEIGKDYFDIKCRENALRIKEIQLEGKKRMPVSAFLLGYKLEEGSKLL